MHSNIFTSFIWKDKINYPYKNNLIHLIEKEYIKNISKKPKNWKCNVHSSAGDDEFLLKNLRPYIEKSLNIFLENHEKEMNIHGQYFLDELWYNVYGPHQFQELHTHGNSLFSGCYYLKFDKEKHHQTMFYNPNFYNLEFFKLESNSYFCHSPDCEEDDIIIFPSNLSHKTNGIMENINYSHKDLRITISFNVSNSTTCKKFKNNNTITYE